MQLPEFVPGKSVRVVWEKKYSPQNDAKWLSDSYDHILVYAKNEDYSLNIVNMPVEPDTAESEPHTDTKTASKKPKRSVRNLPLFDKDSKL
ncbi:MAG: hypothetical protein HZB37_05580 [Planctomycetes bacterium]|nr:hypothetical protein [Planctomycetota bacterium]